MMWLWWVLGGIGGLVAILAVFWIVIIALGLNSGELK